MDRKHKLSAALAALMMAAGIDAASAIESPADAIAAAQQRIESTASIVDLQTELEMLRATDPDSPILAMLMSRIVELSQPPSRREDRLAFDVNAPY
ncbi:hypothetical protein [Devosia enhydra]|nr:hypothetical protein [Devosia enhydra]